MEDKQVLSLMEKVQDESKNNLESLEGRLTSQIASLRDSVNGLGSAEVDGETAELKQMIAGLSAPITEARFHGDEAASLRQALLTNFVEDALTREAWLEIGEGRGWIDAEPESVEVGQPLAGFDLKVSDSEPTGDNILGKKPIPDDPLNRWVYTEKVPA